MSAVHVVVPDGIDDPFRPSGGNAYDRQVCRHIGALGWSVHEHAVPGPWPRRERESLAALAGVVQRIPDDAIVLLDGLVGSAGAEALVPEASRLRLVMLVHMPLGHRPPDEAVVTRSREALVLRAAAAVVTTSQWSRQRLRELYQLPPDRVHVAEPGVEAGELATGTAAGNALLCVAAVTFDKGHDILLDALQILSDFSWRCVWVGSLDRDPSFVSSLRRRVTDGGLQNQVWMAGPRTGYRLQDSYSTADLVVLPSRAESYGMVLTEALARGLPVAATDVGGVKEAVGYAPDGVRPGLLLPPEDPAALAAALRAWLSDARLRERLRQAASARRESLRRWSATASVLAGVFAGVGG